MEARSLVYVLAASALILLAGLAGYALWANTAQAHGGESGVEDYQGRGMMGGMMGMGGGMGAPAMSEAVHGGKEYPQDGYEEGFMDMWCWQVMDEMGFPMDPEMPLAPISLEAIQGTVKEVSVRRMILVVETEEGATVTLRALSKYVDMSDGSLTFGPWILAQLEPGDTVSVKAVVRGGERGVALGISFDENEYLHPMVAFRELAGEH